MWPRPENTMRCWLLVAARRSPVDVKELRQGAFDGGVVEPQGIGAALLVQRDAEQRLQAWALDVATGRFKILQQD